ncbi:MAG: bifunctional diguanylate cyclase/phosphodiesterase [Clostridia bacterium]
MSWIVEPEYVACILIVIILGYSLLDRSMPSFQTKVFRASMCISLAAIFINIFSIYTIEHSVEFPVALNIILCTMYFAMTSLMATSIAAVGVTMMFENRYDSQRFWRAIVLLGILYLLYLSLVVANLWTGWLFWFDEGKNYVRGPLNKIGIALLCCILLNVIACYILEFRRVDKVFRAVIITLNLLATVLVALQSAFPNTMLTGTNAALALLVLFIYGQQQRRHVDHLTDLSNREMFYHTLERFAERGIRMHVAMVSLRGFKSINVRYGQRMGDRLLQQIGTYLGSLHKSVVAYRFSGVEFALIIARLPEAAYESLFAVVQRRFESPWQIDGVETMLCAAFADVAYPEHAGNINELIASLEYAVRLAKSQQGVEPVRFNKQLRNALGRRNYVIGSLETAMQENRYILNFQPIFDCESRKFFGAEVLLRLREANGQIISPAEFIPLAEETGEIHRISWMVIDRACAFMSEHRDCGIEWLAVNVCEQQYSGIEAANRILEVLEKYKLLPSMLKLEMTEHVLIMDMDRARETVLRLMSRGVGVCLDDFGTGYSNLANVMMLPFECVKIDKSFVDSIEQEHSAYVLLETVIKGLKAMDVHVLVEGVETELQNNMMLNLGVNCIQGFYHARPMNDDAFIALMKQQQNGTAYDG